MLFRIRNGLIRVSKYQNIKQFVSFKYNLIVLQNKLTIIDHNYIFSLFFLLLDTSVNKFFANLAYLSLKFRYFATFYAFIFFTKLYFFNLLRPFIPTYAREVENKCASFIFLRIKYNIAL